MQEAIGIMLGALAALLAASCAPNNEHATTLASHRIADGSISPRHRYFGHGQLLATSLALLSCLLLLGAVAWSVLGFNVSAELPRNSIQQQERNRYVAPAPKAGWFFRIPSDGLDSPRLSRLVVKEDGKPLGPPHSLHADIAEGGAGRFSHWDTWVVFSSSDNSDPRENGRNYTVAFRLMPSPIAWLLALSVFAVLLTLRATRDGFVAIARALVSHPMRIAARALCVAIIFLVVAWGLAGLSATRSVKVASIQHLGGNAYFVSLPERSALITRTGDSATRRGAAALQVLEDGRALGPANTPHTIIGESGGGRYSHWDGSVVFSTSDNSDPRGNGRSYQLSFRTYPGLVGWLVAFLAIALLLAAPRSSAERVIARFQSSPHIAFAVLFLGAFALALVYLGQRFLAVVDPSVDMQAPVFGSASAPYSDALLWIFGGLQFLLEGPDVALNSYLYRPTIGILFGSVMAVFNSAEAVPVFFFFSLLAVVAIGGLITIGTRIALMLGLWAMLCAALPGAPLWHTFVNVPMPDLPALLFSISGLLLVLLFLNQRAGVVALCLGLMLLGIATAIRGALLPAGFLLIVLCCWQRGWKNVAPLAIAGLASFFAPFILDSLMRQYYQTDNNAVIAFYCVVHDATRFWTSACDEMYRRQGVTAVGAITDYLRFAFSHSGIRFLLSGFAERVRHDFVSLSHPAFVVALVLAALAGIRSLAAAPKLQASSRRNWIGLASESRPVWISFIVVTASVWVTTIGPSWLAVVFLFFCLTLSLVRRDFIALACFAVYLSGLIMMTAIGAGPIFGVNTDRITATYSFALALGLLAFVIGNDASAPQGRTRLDMRWGRRITVGAAGAVVFLYCAVWIWPSTWRSRFESDVVGKKAALKVLDNAAMDRSGYYVFVPNANGPRGAGALIYTRRDELPIGSVRRYEKLMNNQAFIGSFLEPNALLQ